MYRIDKSLWLIPNLYSGKQKRSYGMQEDNMWLPLSLNYVWLLHTMDSQEINYAQSHV